MHGDDFVSVGSRAAAHDLKKKLESRFEIKTQILGRGGGEEKIEGRVLNRIVRATEGGWEYEADQRHVDITLADLGLAEANPVNIPSEDEKAWEKEKNEKEMTGDRATRYRAIAARANYLATDRPDIMYSTKKSADTWPNQQKVRGRSSRD